jgi:hypothetical protein
MGLFFTVIDNTPGIDATEATVDLSKCRQFVGAKGFTLATEAETKLRHILVANILQRFTELKNSQGW